MSDDLDLEDDDVKTSKRLTPAEWARVVTLWELGEVTLATLSTDFGISARALHKGLVTRGAVKGSKAHEIADATRKAIVESHKTAAADTADERQAKIENTRKEHYEWSRMLARQTMGILAKAQKDEKPFSTVDDDLKALQRAARTLQIVRGERYVILDVESSVDTDELAELQIRDLSSEDIKEIKAHDEDDGEIIPSTDEEVVVLDD